MFHLARNLYRYCKAQTERELSLVLIGLPNAGKSTIKQVLANNLTPLTVPTIGVTMPVKLKIGKYRITIYDLGGQVTDLWRQRSGGQALQLTGDVETMPLGAFSSLAACLSSLA